MTTNTDLDRVKRLVLRHGTPAAPAVETLVTEVRSDGIAKTPLPPEEDHEHVLGTLIIEWDYALSLTEMDEFHEFLADNEKFIADACEKLMEGVHYYGTYVALTGDGAFYRTIWTYDTEQALDAWKAALDNKSSKFYAAMVKFRWYWAKDPTATEQRYAPAAHMTNLAETGGGNPFLALTIAAELGRGAPPAKRGGKRRRPSA